MLPWTYKNYDFPSAAAYAAALAAMGWASGPPPDVELIPIPPTAAGQVSVAAGFAGRERPADWEEWLRPGNGTMGFDQVDGGNLASGLTRSAFTGAVTAGQIATIVTSITTVFDGATDVDASIWRRVQSQPVHEERIADPRGGWWELAVPVVTPAMLGPAQADMGPLVLRAMRYAAVTGARVHDKRRRYPCRQKLLPDVAGREINLGCLILDYSTMPASADVNQSGSSTLLEFVGNAPELIGHLTEDLAYGSSLLQLAPADAAKLTTGDAIMVASDYLITGAAKSGYDARASWLARVGSANAVTGMVALWGICAMSRFTVAQNARVWKIDNKTRVVVDDLRIIGSGAVDAQGQPRMQRGVVARNCYANRVGRVWTQGCQRGVWSEVYSHLAHFEMMDFFGDTTAQEGYVLTISSSHGTSFGSIRATRARHVLNTVIHGGEAGREWCSGTLTGNLVVSLDSVGGPIDSHPGADRIQVQVVYAEMSPDASANSGDVLFCQGAGLSVGQCTVGGAHARAVRGQICGWYPYDGYIPQLWVGHLHVKQSVGVMFEMQNASNQDELPGGGQLISGRIERLTGACSSVPVRSSALHGAVRMSVGSMEVSAPGAIAQVQSDNDHDALIQISNFFVRVGNNVSYPFVLDSNKGRIEASNGRISRAAGQRVASARGGVITLRDVALDYPTGGTPEYFAGPSTAAGPSGQMGQVLAYTTPFASVVNAGP